MTRCSIGQHRRGLGDQEGYTVRRRGKEGRGVNKEHGVAGTACGGQGVYGFGDEAERWNYNYSL